jgi:HlyD family secretion protein
MSPKIKIAFTITAAGMLATALAGAWVASGSNEPVYRTEAVSGTPLQLFVTATGTLEPRGAIDIGTDLSGRIESVKVHANDRVAAGDVLVVMDGEQLRFRQGEAEANLDNARARVADAHASLLEAQAKFARAQRLVEVGFVAAQELDTARAALARAEASVQMAHAQVKVALQQVAEANANVRKATIRAPIDGVVIARNVEPGQTVASTFQTPYLLKLAQPLVRMDLRVQIGEADVGAVHEGQAVLFTVDAFGARSYETRITRLHNTPKSVQGAVVYEALMPVENADLALRPGMTASVRIRTRAIDGMLSVPNAAVRFTPPNDRREARLSAPRGESLVWRLRGDGIEPVVVRLGETDGLRTIVSGGGLRTGELLAVDVAAAP